MHLMPFFFSLADTHKLLKHYNFMQSNFTVKKKKKANSLHSFIHSEPNGPTSEANHKRYPPGICDRHFFQPNKKKKF